VTAPTVVALVASILAFLASLISIRWGTSLALAKERRQLLWSKEFDRLLALEEIAGQLVEELASYRATDPATLGPRLEELQNAAGRFSRYDDVRRATLQLKNTLDRMFAAKRDHADEAQDIRSELEPDLKRLLSACDQVIGRDKLLRSRI
jgi:hypothetical protein